MAYLYQYYAQISRQYPLLTAEEEIELASRWQQCQDAPARDRLVLGNLRAVIQEAKKYQGLGFDPQELIQHGLIGLVRAADKYDPESGNRFLTYAYWWIRAEMNRYVEHNLGPVRFGTNEVNRKAQRGIRKAMRHVSSHHPGLSEEEQMTMAAEMLDLPVRLCEQAYRNLGGQIHLEDPAGPGGERTWLDTLFDEADENQVTDLLITDEYRDLLEQALERLDEREATIIRERFLSPDPATLQELGDIFEISRERVRQVERIALHKLKRLLTSQIDSEELA